jgi:hypothetical protein
MAAGDGGSLCKFAGWREIANFQDARYLTWKIRGRVQVEIHKMTGVNAVLNGVFIDDRQVEDSR